MEKKCWICKINEANSNEHTIKRSLIEFIHPELKSNNPVLMTRVNLKNGHKTEKRVYSSKSDKFTFKNSICTDCNNSRTQQHDLSWEKLYRGIYRTPEKGKFITLNKIFKNIEKETLNVHLYWIKITGCMIRDILENGFNNLFGTKDIIWLNGLLNEFSKNILENNENNRLHIYFSKLPHDKKRTTLYPGGLKRTDRVMHYSFIMGNVAISVLIYIYGSESHIIKTWQPHKNMRKIPLYNLKLT